MRILLIKPKHIGDTLLLTPTIVGLRQNYPAAEIWVVVRRTCESILAGCPEIDRLLTVPAIDRRERCPADYRHAVNTFSQLLIHNFNYVFELGDGHRGRFLARCARTPHRYSVRPATPFRNRGLRSFTAVAEFPWTERHRVEKDYRSVAQFLPLPTEIPPLRFALERARIWPPAAHLRDFAVMQIGKRQRLGRWPTERWQEVISGLLDHVTNVVVASGPGKEECEEARRLQQAFGSRLIVTLGRVDWPEMAGLLARARLYVGLDTALMHLAAACRCPIVALFGPTNEANWRPWRAEHRIVAGVSPLAHGEAHRGRSMDSIRPAEVLAACILSLRPPPSAMPQAGAISDLAGGFTATPGEKKIVDPVHL